MTLHAIRRLRAWCCGVNGHEVVYNAPRTAIWCSRCPADYIGERWIVPSNRPKE